MSEQISNECEHALAQPTFGTEAQGSHARPAASLGITVMSCGAVSAESYLAQVSSYAPATPGTWCEAQLPFDLNSEGWRGEGSGRRTPGSWAVSAIVPALLCSLVEALCPPSEG